MTNLLNPKVILFILAFFPQFIDQNNSSTSREVMRLGLVCELISIPYSILVVWLSGWIGQYLQRRRQDHHWGKWVTGSVFILLGIGTAFSSPHF